jgi:hypothetical protein
VIDAGAVQVVYGSASGLSAPGNQLWTQDTPGIADAAEAGDSFGFGLAGMQTTTAGAEDTRVSPEISSRWERLIELFRHSSDNK